MYMYTVQLCFLSFHCIMSCDQPAPWVTTPMSVSGISATLTWGSWLPSCPSWGWPRASWPLSSWLSPCRSSSQCPRRRTDEGQMSLCRYQPWPLQWQRCTDVQCCLSCILKWEHERSCTCTDLCAIGVNCVRCRYVYACADAYACVCSCASMCVCMCVFKCVCVWGGGHNNIKFYLHVPPFFE